MSGKRPARILGAFEHPGRNLPGRTLQDLTLEIAHGAIADAGLVPDDVEALFATGGYGVHEMLGLRNVRHLDTTELGGASYISHAGRAARDIREGRYSVALIVMAGLPRQGLWFPFRPSPHEAYRNAHGTTLVGEYALVARRHMYEHGSTSEDLAQIKVASSYHASFNPNALLPRVVTVEEVLDSPWIADPLHRLDCCVTTDGGGAIVVVADEIARASARSAPAILAQAEAFSHASNGVYDLTRSLAARSGPRALAEAGIGIRDIDYASLYDSFTITLLLNLEGLGFFEPGAGSALLREGELKAPYGRIPVNTDGGGLSNTHPDYRGGMVRMIEAVRQLRGEANAGVQIPDAELAVVHGSGFSMGTGATGSTAVLQRVDE